MARLYQGTRSKVPAPRHQRRTLCQRLCSTPCEQFAGAIKLRRCAVSRPAVHLCSCSLFAPPAARKSVENKPKSTRRTRFAGAATLAQLRQSQKCYPKSRADGRYLHPPRQLTEPHQPGSCMYCVCTEPVSVKLARLSTLSITKLHAMYALGGGNMAHNSMLTALVQHVARLRRHHSSFSVPFSFFSPLPALGTPARHRGT